MTDPDLGGELVVRLFHARTRAHILHLQTRSYSEHKALNEFYDQIVGLADALAENMQGKAGILAYDDISEPDWGRDSKVLLLSLSAWIQENRGDISDATDVQNQIDEVMALISQTFYKIEMLG